jgi:hypothetical protein
MIIFRFLAEFVAQLRGLYRYGDTRVATIASIMSAYLWAGCLAWPGDTLDRPTYRHMAEVMPEDWHWSALFVTVGSLQLWRLYVKTTRKAIPFEYALKAIALSMWTFVGLACMFSIYPPPAAMSDTLVIAVLCWWDFIRFESCRICDEVVCSKGDCPYAR